MCLTAIAAIDAAGGKLPMWIVCRGKTTRCERPYQEDERLEKSIREGDLVLSHEKMDGQVRSWRANISSGCTGTIEGSQLPCCGICLRLTAAVKQKNSLLGLTSDPNSSQPGLRELEKPHKEPIR
jgi:hypothetical protein